jgi:putative hydrolase of the HAD superfamily
MKAILFDFDGVLTIDKYGSDSTLRYLAEKTGIAHETLKREYYKVNKALLIGEYTHRDIWSAFCENVGEHIDFSVLLESFISTPLDNDMLSTVRQLKKKYLIGLVQVQVHLLLIMMTQILRDHQVIQVLEQNMVLGIL